MNKHKPLAGQELLDTVVQSLQDKLAENIVTIDMRAIPGSADWFIVCQGDNTSHTSAIANGVVRTLKDLHTSPWHVEGVEDGRWVLIDYTDVVVHIMLPELREYYDLESLWSEGKKKSVERS